MKISKEQQAFIDYFKGLYVTTTNTEEEMLYFNLLSSNSNVTIYYNDTLTFTLKINESCARINSFEHNYISTPVLQEINGYTNHFWNGVTCLQLSKIINNIIYYNKYWKGVRHIFSPRSVSKYELIYRR